MTRLERSLSGASEPQTTVASAQPPVSVGGATERERERATRTGAGRTVRQNRRTLAAGPQSKRGGSILPWWKRQGASAPCLAPRPHAKSDGSRIIRPWRRIDRSSGRGGASTDHPAVAARRERRQGDRLGARQRPPRVHVGGRHVRQDDPPLQGRSRRLRFFLIQKKGAFRTERDPKTAGGASRGRSRGISRRGGGATTTAPLVESRETRWHDGGMLVAC